VNETLARWNRLPAAEAEKEVLACCGSRAWAQALASERPVTSEAMLLAAADNIWRNLTETDWMEALEKHPRIGEFAKAEAKPEEAPTARSERWSAEEQSQAGMASEAIKIALRDRNRDYEKRFGRTFIVCATGKSAAEILEILRKRLENDPHTELLEAAEEQRQITRIRLQRWLAE
jgi:2-oxo-4-hydroxy-4-carboxy-5-ureidoimidazoline decarboxylase